MDKKIIEILSTMNDRECAAQFLKDLQGAFAKVEAVISDYEGICKGKNSDEWIDLVEISQISEISDAE